MNASAFGLNAKRQLCADSVDGYGQNGKIIIGIFGPYDYVADESADGFLDRFGTRHNLTQPLQSESFPGPVACLNQAIGVEKELIARYELESRFFEFGICDTADGKARKAHDEWISAGSNAHQAWMTGGNVAKLTSRDVEDAVHHREVLFAGWVGKEPVVESPGDFGGADNLVAITLRDA